MFNRSISFIDKNQLNVDLRYQREPSDSKVKDIINNFNEDLFSSLIVALRDDSTYWVIDGSHRLKATLSLQDIKLIPCDVRQSEGPVWEAYIYELLNSKINKIRLKDIFKSRLSRGDPEALELKELLKSLEDKHIDYVNSIGILQDAFATKSEAFKRVWPILVDLYPENSELNGHFIRGFIYLEKKLNPELSLDNFKDKILSIGIAELDKAVKYKIAESNNSQGNVASAIKDRIFLV